MKKFSACPGCKSELRFSSQGALHQEYCRVCPLYFNQYFKEVGDEDITYVTFNTKNFNLYHHYPGTSEKYAGITNVYHLVFPRGEAVQSPALALKNLVIDFDALDKLDNKLKTLTTFL